MVRKWVNYLRGCVEVKVTGAFPERFLNLCAQEGIVFWGMEAEDANTLRLNVACADGKKLEEAARRVMCTVTVDARRGMPIFLNRFRRRYALLLGLAVSLCTVAVLSRFVLTVEVQGNERVPTAVILQEMKRLGVRPGAYGPALNESQISNDALINLDSLAWVSVNLHGTRAEVLVREKAPKPAVVDETQPAHVVADGSGIILRQQVMSGREMFQVGDTVVEGEILISGVIDLKEPQYSDSDAGTLTVRAAGQIYARTWRTLTAVIPLEAQVKAYTGEEETVRSLTVFGRRIQISKNGGISGGMYDKIKSHSTLTLSDGRVLPLTLTKEERRGYRTENVPINEEAGEDLLRRRLEERLAELMEAHEGEVVQTEFVAARRDGLLTVTALAECREEIGETVPFQGLVGHDEP